VSAAPEPARALLLGLGNVLCGDDGLGVIAVERLRERFRWSEEVSLVDGGTLGLSLLSTLEEADEVWILDAVAAAEPPGSLVRLDGADVEPALRERLSPHQVGVADLLDALHWRDRWPRQLRVLGLVPASLALRVGLSDPVAAGLEALEAAAVDEVVRAGHVVHPRRMDAARAHRVDDACLSRALGV
jgi:hydrogenase maturation protease